MHAGKVYQYVICATQLLWVRIRINMGENETVSIRISWYGSMLQWPVGTTRLRLGDPALSQQLGPAIVISHTASSGPSLTYIHPYRICFVSYSSFCQTGLKTYNHLVQTETTQVVYKQAMYLVNKPSSCSLNQSRCLTCSDSLHLVSRMLCYASLSSDSTRFFMN